MIKAEREDKKVVIDILTQSFASNQSIQYLVKNDKYFAERLAYLMDYSFDICYNFGEVYLSKDKMACALISFPNRRKPFLKSTILDIKLLLKTTGLKNASKAIKRESAIKKNYPDDDIFYLWFIGVKSDLQGKGIGTKLLNDVMKRASDNGQSIYLETSTDRNLPWYRKHGFTIYNKIDFGYTLYLLKS
ncbi:MAG: GNAT family N-acetyltransferase, partial [Olivibacter sp.]|nr:GNAT family N-acetyltransferase [Olivibacter sp. UJ_SKK_5.1]